MVVTELSILITEYQVKVSFWLLLDAFGLVEGVN